MVALGIATSSLRANPLRSVLATLGVIIGVAALVAVLSPAAHAAFPGKNGKIAFSTGTDVFTVNLNGSGLQNLTNDATPDRQPAWHPDGTKIAFVWGGSGGSPGQIHVMNADGSGLAPLSNPQAGENPAWSPDGTKIAFTRTVTVLGVDQVDVVTVNADGSITLSDRPGIGFEGQAALYRIMRQLVDG